VIVFFLIGLILLPMVNVPKAIEEGKRASVLLAGAAVEAGD
jgi:hypothetical protein